MLTPKEIFESCIKTGENKATMPFLKTLVLAVFAGMFIALAGVAASFGNVYAGKLAGACIFPAGLAMVVVAGSELFTGNCLMLVAYTKGKITLSRMLRNWGIVLVGNFIGAMLIVALAVYSGAMDGIKDAVISTASAKVSLSFFDAVFRGILCNILICIAVWMSFSAKSVEGKILAVFFPVMCFVICGFEHSIADMFYVPAGILEAARFGEISGALNFGNYIVANLLPVVLGNLIGGLIVSGGYYLGYGRGK